MVMRRLTGFCNLHTCISKKANQMHLLMMGKHFIEDVEIFFGELDYQEVEGDGSFEVVVTKMGSLQSALFLTITPLTFNEFRERGLRLPNEQVFDELNTIDPAESKHFL